MPKKNYREIFKKLPPELQDIVASTESSTKIYAICKKHSVLIDESQKIIDLTLDVVMGILPSKDLRGKIISEVKLEPLKAAAVVREIDEQIFKPVKEIMLHIYGDGAPFANGTESSSLQKDETEDEHKNIDRDSLLAEIENPPEAQVKKVFIEPITKDNQIQGETPKITEVKIETGTKNLEQEPVKNTPPLEPKTPNFSKENLLKNFANVKLSGITTMPKQNIIDVSSEVKTQETIKETQKEIEEEKIAIKPKEETPQNYTRDPYREPIE